MAVASLKSLRSSASSFTYEGPPDVFISFRGVDTRSGFTGNLHKALLENRVKAFMDDKNLPSGADISRTLDKAIQESRIALVIFSINYASSKFCLEELAKIVECSEDKGMLVLPVFYQMDPGEVRHQTRSYAEALAKHETRYGKEKVKKWRLALEKVANKSGWHIKVDTDRREYDHIEDIFQDVSNKMSSLGDRDKNQIICNVDDRYIVQQDRQPIPQSSSWKHRGVEQLPGKQFDYKKITEEKSIGEDNMLIHVYHLKTRAPNQKHIQNFGDPFVLVIRKDDKIAKIKSRVQNNLQIPYDHMSEWKFVTVSNDGVVEDLEGKNRPKFVSERFKRGSTYGDWDQYLGLEHHA